MANKNFPLYSKVFLNLGVSRDVRIYINKEVKKIQKNYAFNIFDM